jgi:hypothetical protein
MKSMRGVLNSLVILFILGGLALVAYYVNQRQKASYRGEEYTFSQAPLDLADEIGEIFKSTPPTHDDEVPPGQTPMRTDPTPEKPTVDTAALTWQEGRKHYLAGDFPRALAAFKRSRRGAAPNGQVDIIETRARLFALLLGRERSGAALEGPPQALITLPAGEPFFAEVVKETEDDITFRREGGVGARVRKNELRDLRVADGPGKKRSLGESEYQRRHTELKTPADFLALARFCYDFGLEEHLTYLLERGLDTPGDGIEAALFARYKEARETTGAVEQAELAVELLKQFFRGGQYTRTAVLDSLPAAAGGRPGIGVNDPNAAGNGSEPPSGIGGSALVAPRSTDPEVNALLVKADGLRAEADRHYRQAMPGSPDRATHRDKALKLYEEAIGVYEAVQERWDVGLDSIFKDLLQKRYALLKDKPIR